MDLKLIKIFLFLILFSPHARGFLYIQGTYNKGARPVSTAPIWSGRKLSYYLNTDTNTYASADATNLAKIVSNANWAAAVTDAVNAWAAVCNSDLTVEIVGTTSTGWTTNGINTIVYDARTVAEGNVFSSQSTLGMALPINTSNVMSECDIAINGDMTGTFGVGGESTKYDLVSTLAHEIGHCLGLDHSVEPGAGSVYSSANTILLDATMAAYQHTVVGDIVRRTINQDDNDGASCVYQTGKDFRGGDGCSSYSGTNGGASVAGTTLTVGPTEDLASCVSKPEVTFITKGIMGNGCVLKGSTGEASGSEKPFDEIVLCLILIFLWKFRTVFQDLRKSRSD